MIMKKTDFSEYVSRFLTTYLVDERGSSKGTITTYKYSMIQFIRFMDEVFSISVNKLQIKDITYERVKMYLLWLEKEKHLKVATRNSRLCVLHSFLKYVQLDNLEFSLEIQKILSISQKKCFSDTINFLSIEGVKLLLSIPDKSTKKGRRDTAMLALLYDSGCRVQELVNLDVSSLSFEKPPTLKVIGKGNKARLIPLMDNDIDILTSYMKENNIFKNPLKLNEPLFFNSKGDRFTRQNINSLVKEYASQARRIKPDLIPQKVSPHTLRHSRAMHLLQSGVNVVYIRDFLGHVSIRTTEIYAKADSKSKREAIEKAYVQLTDDNKAEWQNNQTLLDWLENL